MTRYIHTYVFRIPTAIRNVHCDRLYTCYQPSSRRIDVNKLYTITTCNLLDHQDCKYAIWRWQQCQPRLSNHLSQSSDILVAFCRSTTVTFSFYQSIEEAQVQLSSSKADCCGRELCLERYELMLIYCLCMNNRDWYVIAFSLSWSPGSKSANVLLSPKGNRA